MSPNGAGNDSPQNPEIRAGTVTFLFTDIEGSTKLLHELGPEAFARGAAVLALAGEGHRAAELIASAVAFHEDAGLEILPYLAEENEGALTRIHSQLDGAAFDEAWERGGRRSVEDAAGLALEALGRLATTWAPKIPSE